jgi:hypothetical protein
MSAVYENNMQDIELKILKIFTSIVIVINCAYGQMHVICKELQGTCIHVHNLYMFRRMYVAFSKIIIKKEFIKVQKLTSRNLHTRS